MRLISLALVVLLILTASTFATSKNEAQKFLKLNPVNEFKTYLDKPFDKVLKIIKITPGKGAIPDDIFIKGLSKQADGSWGLMKPPQIYGLYLGPELSWNRPETRKIAVGLKGATFGVSEKGIIDFIHFEYNIFQFEGKTSFGTTGSYMRPVYRKKDIIGLDNYDELPKDGRRQVYVQADDNYVWFLVMTTNWITTTDLSEGKIHYDYVGDYWFVNDLYALKKSSMLNYLKEISPYLNYDYDFCMIWLDKLYGDGILTEAEYNKVKGYFNGKLFVTVTDEAGEREVSLPKILYKLQEMLDLAGTGWSSQSDKENLLKDIK